MQTSRGRPGNAIIDIRRQADRPVSFTQIHATISLANRALSCHRGLYCTCHDMGNAPGTVVERMQP